MDYKKRILQVLLIGLFCAIIILIPVIYRYVFQENNISKSDKVLMRLKEYNELSRNELQHGVISDIWKHKGISMITLNDSIKVYTMYAENINMKGDKNFSDYVMFGDSLYSGYSDTILVFRSTKQVEKFVIK